jgi:HSP20 family protein
MPADQTPAPTAPSAPAPARHDPFHGFRAEMDRLVDSFFGRGGAPFAAFDAPAPSVEIEDRPEALTLTAELPGMAAGDVELTVRNGALTLSGEKKRESETRKGDLVVSERRYGAFRRSFALPDDVDADRAEARFEGGVLTVTLPRKPQAAAAPRRIAIA